MTKHGAPINEERIAKEELRNNYDFRDYFFFTAGYKSTKDNKHKEYLKAKEQIENILNKKYVLTTIGILSEKIFGERWLGPLDESTIKMKVFKKEKNTTPNKVQNVDSR